MSYALIVLSAAVTCALLELQDTRRRLRLTQDALTATVYELHGDRCDSLVWQARARFVNRARTWTLNEIERDA